MTAVGVVVGFSLGFVTTWANNPLPWEFADALAIGPLLSGIVFQMVSLSRLLNLNSLEIPVYERAVRLFLIGLVLTAVGVSLGIVVDLFELSHAALPSR